MPQDVSLPDSLEIANTAWLLRLGLRQRSYCFPHRAEQSLVSHQAVTNSCDIAAAAWLLRHSAYAHAAASHPASPRDDSHSMDLSYAQSMPIASPDVRPNDPFPESSDAVIPEPIQETNEHVLPKLCKSASFPFLTPRDQPDASRAYSPCRGSSLGPRPKTSERSDASGGGPAEPVLPPHELPPTNPMLSLMLIESQIEEAISNSTKKRQRARKKGGQKQSHAEPHVPCTGTAKIKGHQNDAENSPNTASGQRYSPSNKASSHDSGTIKPQNSAMAKHASCFAPDEDSPSEHDLSHIICSNCQQTGHCANKCFFLPHDISSESSTAKKFPENSVSSSYVPPVAPSTHAVPKPIPESQIVLSLIEKDAILRMHWLGIDMAEASQPIELLHADDWHERNEQERANAISFWDTRREHLRRRVAEESTEIPSLRFSESFKKTGVGSVYARAFSPNGTNSKQFYEIPSHQLANIFGDDTYSGISGCFEPARVSHDVHTDIPPEVPPEHVVPKPTPLKPLVVSSTEKVTIRDMRRLATQLACADSTGSRQEQDNLWETMQTLNHSAPSLRYSKDFLAGASGRVAILRPAREFASHNSAICMHWFPMSPEELSNILCEDSNHEDDAASSPDEWECLRRAVLHQEGVPDDCAGTAPSRHSGPPPERPAYEPIPPLVITPTEQADIRKMHSACVLMPKYSKPLHTLAEEWDSWSEDTRAKTSMLWQSQQDILRDHIAEGINALTTLRFSQSFLDSGEGYVYVVRELPPVGDVMRTRQYELGPSEISRILEGDPSFDGHFEDLPTHTERHRQPFLPDPAEVQAVLDMQRLQVDSEKLGYSVWGKSLQFQYPYKDEDAAYKHGLVLADMAHLQNKFPHLDFDSLVARLDPSVATFDPECLTWMVGSIQQSSTTPNLQTILEDPMWDPKFCAARPIQIGYPFLQTMPRPLPFTNIIASTIFLRQHPKGLIITALRVRTCAL